MGRPRSKDYLPIDECYFEVIDEPIKAYLFGLLWADAKSGYITKRVSPVRRTENRVVS